MNTVIKLEVPLENEALYEAANTLITIADGLTDQDEKRQSQPVTKPEGAPDTKPEAQPAKPEAAPTPKPTGAPPPPPVNAAEVERDSRGYAHDERIHITPGKFKKDGTWKNRRSIDKELVATVEAELELTASAEGAPPPPATETAPPPPPVTAPAEGAPPPPPVTAPPSAVPVDYPHLIGKITRVIKTDKLLTQEQVNEILKSNGIAAMPLLAAAAPEVWQKISDTIDVMVGA